MGMDSGCDNLVLTFEELDYEIGRGLKILAEVDQELSEFLFKFLAQ